MRPENLNEGGKGFALKSEKPIIWILVGYLKKACLVLAFLVLPMASPAGQLGLGVQYAGWSSNFQPPFSGWEILTPLAASLNLSKDFQVYGNSEFADGHYTESSQTINLSNVSDTVLGGQLSFKNFDLPALLDVAFNLPTGDQSWEVQQYLANVPTAFVDTRYQGRGFGISALYGISFPSGGGDFGAGVGYMYSGAFNPNANLVPNPGTQLKLGDSIFVAANHVQTFSDGNKEVIRASAFFSVPTQENGVNSFQLGTNFNASYGWNNPTAFSLELGGQVYLPCKREINGQFTAEPTYSYGPRFYLTPSYAIGDLTLSGVAKYVFPNGYNISNLDLYNGGGFMAGLEPSWKLSLDETSALRFFVSYDRILAHNYGYDINNNPTDAIYDFWNLGTHYEIRF